MKESKFVKTKIAAGYLLLVAACILSVGYVYRTTVRFSTPDTSYALLRTKRNLINQILYHLYRAEGFGQLILAGDSGYDERRDRELLRVRDRIDSLRALPGQSGASDTLQQLRLDSIVRLLDDKQRRTAGLRRAIRSAADGRLLEKNIHKITGPAAPIVPETFDGPPIPGEEKLLGSRTSHTAENPASAARRTARMPRIFVGDTIALLLQALRDSVSSERSQIDDRAWRESLRLQSSNELVDNTIYRLILDYETEETDYLVARIRRNEELRQRSSHVLGGITFAAVLLMLLFVAILWRDVNRSNRYRRELEQANRDKEALLRAREQLMLAITHDIKAPLGSITGYIDLLSRLTGGKRQELYLGNMRRSAEHLLALVDTLLDFHRLDIRKVEVHDVDFSPAQLFETIRSGFAAPARAKGLALRLEVGAEARKPCRGDALRIRQIADNLLSNALKFTDRGSVTLRADLRQGRLVFSVRDTGRGIARAEKNRIFNEFVRLDSTRDVEGFGLGLSIVDRLVQLLGGSVSVESRPGEGSRFIVSLPVGEASAPEIPETLEAPAAEATTPHTAAPEALPPARKLRVLAIDDDPMQGELVRAICLQAGIEARYCQEPRKALEAVGEEPFDALLTDIQMPSLDGFALRALLRRQAPALPVIAISAREELGPRGSEFDAVLRKPFSARELVAAIASVCHAPTPRPTDPGTPALETVASDAPAADFDALTAFAGDDPEAAQAILRTFVEQHTDACKRMRQALETRDAEALRGLAHRMLPIFTMLRAETIATTLRRTEQAPDQTPEEELRTALEKIEEIVAEARKRVTL